MEKLTIICEHLQIDEFAIKLTNYLKINGFECLQLKKQIYNYKFSNPKTSFNLTIDISECTISECSTKANFTFCSGDQEYFHKKFKDAEILFSTEKDPQKNVKIFDILNIYYSSYFIGA
jgi:hypothetical protein